MPGLSAALAAAGSASSAAPAPAAQASSAQPMAVRVREAGSASFRRVVLQAAESAGAEGGGGAPAGPPCFQEVEKRICTKFSSSRGQDGQEVGLRRLVTLVRIADSLEVADDEDAALLRDGDEMEATFAAL